MCVLNDQEEAGYFYHDLMQLTASNEVYFFPSAYRRAIKYGHVDPANEILRTEVLSRLRPGRLFRDRHVSGRLWRNESWPGRY